MCAGNEGDLVNRVCTEEFTNLSVVKPVSEVKLQQPYC